MVVHQIVEVLVVQMKLLSLQYLMDEAQEYEVYLLYDSLKYANRPEWEQTRLLMYILAQVNSKKQLKIEDLMSFAWDEKAPELTEEEKMKAQMENAKKYKELMKSKEAQFLKLTGRDKQNKDPK